MLLTRSDAALLTAWSRAAPVRALEDGGAAAMAWLGAPLVVRTGPPDLEPALPPDAPWPTACLVCGAATGALSIDPRVAAALIDRALGGEATDDATAGPLTDVERGVLAYAMARWIAGTGWSVGAVLAHAGPAQEHLGGARVRFPLELGLGAARGRAMLVVSGAPPSAPATTPADDVPLALSAVAGYAVVTARDLSALRPGDVLVPDRVDVRPCAEGPPAGAIALRARGHDVELRCGLSRGALIYEATVPRRAPGVGRRLEDAMAKDDAPLSALGDTPVTLTIELGRFELTLNEIGGLVPGAIVATGRPLDARVTLRAGDRVVGEGELVEVEGEVAVRLSEVGRAGVNRA